MRTIWMCVVLAVLGCSCTKKASGVSLPRLDTLDGFAGIPFGSFPAAARAKLGEPTKIDPPSDGSVTYWWENRPSEPHSILIWYFKNEAYSFHSEDWDSQADKMVSALRDKYGTFTQEKVNETINYTWRCPRFDIVLTEYLGMPPLSPSVVYEDRTRAALSESKTPPIDLEKQEEERQRKLDSTL